MIVINNKKLLFSFLMSIALLVTGCGSDRAGEVGKKEVAGVSAKDIDGDGISDTKEVELGTDPTNPDSDGDGLKDGEELNIYHTNPKNPDSDGDGLKDGDELNSYHTNPKNIDSDGDGLNDAVEINTYGTNPNDVDSDDDNLTDSQEINTHDTNATNPDTDGDGLNDGDEINSYHTNPKNTDSDGDGLNDAVEVNTYGTNPNDVDSDDDNLTDSQEINTHDTNATNPDTDGDGLNDGDEINSYHTNPKNTDSDGDGLNDAVEINTYGTNPNDVDSDDDNLTDSQEINTHDTNATNPDTDGDGLNDGEEVTTYSTDPKDVDSDDDSLSDGDEVSIYQTNPNKLDTDDDCLPDNHEVLNYLTDANDADTDRDGVEDGYEIYGDITASCEQRNVLKENPENDNIPKGDDTIDALDPTNDSDGDGWANIQESNCTDGEPTDTNQTCQTIIDTTEGKVLIDYGYTFIPGGFDVDGDGVDEGGFWTSAYQATKDGNDGITNDQIKSTVGDNFNAFIVDNFSLINSNEEIDGFIATGGFPLRDYGQLLTFKKSDILDDSNVSRKNNMKRYVGAYPYMAKISMKYVSFDNTDAPELNGTIDMLTNKQYTHIQKLLDKDKEINGENNDSYVPVIRNGLLGIDMHVPLSNYVVEIKEFDKNHLEFVSDTLHMYDGTNTMFNESTDIQDWWDINDSDYPTTDEGTNSRVELRDISGDGEIDGIVSPTGGYYAVIVRGGHYLNLKEGIAGGNSASNTAIGFRAATDYLY